MYKTIFYLEGRGGKHIYHFLIYNLGGLYYIDNKNYNLRGLSNTSLLLNDHIENKYLTTNRKYSITYPIYIYMKDIEQFHRDAFDIIKDKFILIDNLPNEGNNEEFEIVSIYGESCIKDGYLDNHSVLFYLRDLFITRIIKKYDIHTNKKRIFITRKNSEIYHTGTLKRYIINEDDIKSKLIKYGFEYIQLEDYNFEQKIKLFMESEIILSSHSGALTFAMFCNTNTKIIEILNKGTYGFINNHYKYICNILNINYFRYSNIYEDYMGNFNLDFEIFEPFLTDVINK